MHIHKSGGEGKDKGAYGSIEFENGTGDIAC